MELAGKDFWTELTGDEEFYIKLIRYMDKLPEKYVEDFDALIRRPRIAWFGNLHNSFALMMEVLTGRNLLSLIPGINL